MATKSNRTNETTIAMPLGELVKNDPATSSIFMQYGLDYCCGGKQTLEMACRSRGIEVSEVLSSLALLPQETPPLAWDTVSLQEIIRHVLSVYHAPLPEELRQLVLLVGEVVAAHGKRDPVRLSKLQTTIRQLADELSLHMRKEEEILFPWIESGRLPAPEQPIAMMEMEHVAAGELLEQLRILTEDYSPPDGACTKWRTLYARLENLDRDLRTHIHIENDILFPRALDPTRA